MNDARPPSAHEAPSTDRPGPEAGEGRPAHTPATEEASLHDLDLIRTSLSRTPEERLAVLQDFVDTFWQPTHG